MKNKKNIKILFVIPNSEISGAEHQLILLVENIDKNIFDVEVCCLDGEGPFTRHIKKINVKCYEIYRNGSFDFYRLIKLNSIIKSNNFDFIVPFCWSAIQYTRLVSFLNNVKHIACERGHDYNLFQFSNIISMVLEPISDLIIFNSKIQMENYKQKLRLKKIPLKTIHNGINIKRFIPQNSKILLNHLNLPKETVLIGTIGNFSSHKNFDMFINVCSKLLINNENLHFVAIGDSIYRKGYESIIDKKGLSKNFSFLGYVKEINNLLPNLEILILTSTWEGMPNVVMEAMASKVLVVSTNIDGVRELIDDGKNGFLVESKDVDAMVGVISNILNDRYNIDNVINNAFVKISNNFSIENMVNQYQKTFISLYE